VSRYRSERFKTNSENFDLTVESGLIEFFAYHQRKGDSQSYLNELRSYLVGGTHRFGKTRSWLPLLRWSKNEGIRNVSALDRLALGSYLDHVRSLATRGDYGKVCAILKRLFEFFVLDDIIEAAPMRIDQPKRLKAEIKVFTEEEMLRLRDVVAKETPRDWAIFMLLNDTGLRAKELCLLRLDDIRWERRELAVRPAVAKNKTFRIIPLGASLPALRRYLDVRGADANGCDLFFLAYYSTPIFARCSQRRLLDRHDFCNAGLTRNGLFFLIKKWGRLAGITEARCSPHTFRHYFATQYLRRGGNILSLQRILGHSRLEVTERYLRYASADVKAEHERFSPAVSLAQGRFGLARRRSSDQAP
jgi:site-specific recombinase XerD